MTTSMPPESSGFALRSSILIIMCGIAGIIGSGLAERMRAMLQSMEHRGRDDEGIWLSGPLEDNAQVCLGHRRLSIIDTSSAGHQPMISAKGRFVVTFNGEIYNYRDLRKTLEAAGHSFKTESDTEVLLAAWEQW